MEDVEEISQLARKLLLESGHFGPTVFLKGSDGKLAIGLDYLTDDSGEKAKTMANAGVFAAVKHNVGELESLALATEAWMGRPIMEDGHYIRPSTDPKRVEALIITTLIVATQEQAMIAFEIVRTPGKTIIDVKPIKMPKFGSIVSPLLPAFLKGYQFVTPSTN